MVCVLYSLWSLIRGTLTWAPAGLLGALRRRRLARRAAVRLVIGAPGQTAEGVLAVLSMMTRDPALRVVCLKISGSVGGWASARAIRRAIDQLRQRGVLVVAWLESVTARELYLASAADRVWLLPCAEVFLGGVGARLSFYGPALERLGLRFDVESAGAFKSFGEPFTRAFPTSENREQVTALVEDLQAVMLSGIAEGRGLELEALTALLGTGPLSAEEAVAAGLADGLAYPDQLPERIGDLLDGRARMRSFRGYLRWRRLERWLRAERRSPVVVVHLQGAIGDDPGRGVEPRIVPDHVVPLLDGLRRSRRVRAVVLAVNSPGGSALASDLIARAVRRLVEAKPVVAAFGDVSASGGYYLSAPATEIVAEENTLTGSIGVVGGKLVLGEALARVGVHSEAVSAGPDAGMMAPWDPFSVDQRRRFRASLQRIYGRFLQVVAAGRRRPVRTVEPVAQGRVWSGRQALVHGLVDHLGGVDTAVSRARVLADLPDRGRVYHVYFRPPRLRRLLGRLGAAAGVRLTISGPLGRLLGLTAAQSRLAALVWENPMQALAVLPWELDQPSP